LNPSFELPDTELKMRTLDEFKGKKIVLSFIVAASSPVCEAELCTFRDSWQEISDLGAQVLQTKHLQKNTTLIFHYWEIITVKQFAITTY
jgi:peroxiredoxin